MINFHQARDELLERCKHWGAPPEEPKFRYLFGEYYDKGLGIFQCEYDKCHCMNKYGSITVPTPTARPKKISDAIFKNRTGLYVYDRYTLKNLHILPCCKVHCKSREPISGINDDQIICMCKLYRQCGLMCPEFNIDIKKWYTVDDSSFYAKQQDFYNKYAYGFSFNVLDGEHIRTKLSITEYKHYMLKHLIIHSFTFRMKKQIMARIKHIKDNIHRELMENRFHPKNMALFKGWGFGEEDEW